MTQSDAEHGEPVGEPVAGDQHVMTKEEDITDYHGQLLEQLRHVEDNINKFAIQNYAASGAVVLAYLADKAPLWATIIIVALLNINFAITIFVQATRVHKLFTMHCIVRNFCRNSSLFCFCSLWHRLMSTWPTLTRASRGGCRSTVQAVFGPNFANNLFASSLRRPACFPSD
jgi:hypothetical protein